MSAFVYDERPAFRLEFEDDGEEERVARARKTEIAKFSASISFLGDERVILRREVRRAVAEARR